MINRGVNAGRFTPLLIALLCVIAIGLAAATLTNASTAGVINPGGGPRDIVGGDSPFNDGGNAQGGEVGTIGGAGEGYIDFTYCIDWLTSPLAVLGIAMAYVGVISLIAYVFSIAAGALVGLTFIPPITVTYFFFTNCAATITGPGGPRLPSGFGDLGGGGTATPMPLWMVMSLLVGVVVVGGAVVLWSATGDEEFQVEEEEAAMEGTDVSEIAAAAGEAADRIEAPDADIDNEVFRAWREMTDHLEVPSPESSTPGEFATAAIDAGMDRDDVMALTRLFEEVRYGQAEASPEREDQAVEILRRIESEYGRPEPDAEPDESADTETDDE